jgi:hypothetical protein
LKLFPELEVKQQVVGFIVTLVPCFSLDCNFGINSIKLATEFAVAWLSFGASVKAASELICLFALCSGCSHFLVGLPDKSSLKLLLKACIVRYSHTIKVVCVTISQPLSIDFGQGEIQVRLRLLTSLLVYQLTLLVSCKLNRSCVVTA